MSLKDTIELERQEDSYYLRISKIMSDKVSLRVQSTASLQNTSALRICQERRHLLGNGQADGGGGGSHGQKMDSQGQKI